MLYCAIGQYELFDLEELFGKRLTIKILRNGKYARISSLLLENGMAVIGKIYFTNPHFRGEWDMNVRLVEFFKYNGHFTLRLVAEEATEISSFQQRMALQNEFFLALESKKTLFVDYGKLNSYMEH
jgi:hypothetical protein